MSRWSSRPLMVALSYVEIETKERPMKRQNIQPEALSKRVMGGHVLYSHVVVVEGRKTIFVAGQLARDRNGEAGGRGDMRAQIPPGGEDNKAALAAAGGPLGDNGKTNPHVTDHRGVFQATEL